MELDGNLFSINLQWFVGSLYFLILLFALWHLPWRRLVTQSAHLHLFLGTCVVILLLWSLRIDVQLGLEFHLLGTTSLTLMFGWPLAVVGTTLALLGVTFNGDAHWSSFFFNAILIGILPIAITQLVLVLGRRWLPKHFFIYVLVNAFLASGFAAILIGYSATFLLIYSGSYSYLQLKEILIPFFPLMFFPEAWLNGWIMTMLVVFRPQWVGSFDDAVYLQGK